MQYNDSDQLYPVFKGYNEATRMLMFHSTPIEADRLQEALDLIGEYNKFNSKTVGKVLLERFKDAKFIVGREYSVCVYVIIPRGAFWVSDLQKIQAEALIDEVSVENDGKLRLWWD